MGSVNDLINQSLQLMLIGMGSVFVILISLIFLITAVSNLLSRFVQDEGPSPARPAVTTQPDQELVAVISSAVNQFRRKQ